MNLASLNLPDLIGALLGLFFTLAIFSYVLADNFLFRLAIHIFIGVAAGFTAMMAIYTVIWPRLLQPLTTGQPLMVGYVAVPLLLSILMLFKLSSRLAGWGNLAMTWLVGVGVATAVGGAVMGTIFPQSFATINWFGTTGTTQSGEAASIHFIKGIVILLGALSAIIYFHFGTHTAADGSTQRNPFIDGIAVVGQVFIAITFGSLFAGVYAAALTALIERWHFIVTLFFR